MYEEFFGLDRRPFPFQPDATCVYWTAQHETAFATLQTGVARQSPITLVTGEVGCGKTTLIRHFLENAPANLTIGLLSNFISGRGSVLEWTLMAFDQNFEEGSQPDLLQRFQEFTVAEYAAGRRTALIVDEAQNISADDLESLRLLSNVNADGDVLLLMFLFGQPELRERLADPRFRQISQRIGSDFHLSAMTEEETAEYVRYLLEQAGAKYDIFDEQSLRVIHETTSGIPRKINLLSDLCLVLAFADDLRAINAEFIHKILADLGSRGIFASLMTPSAEAVAIPQGTPLAHIARAPKVVGLADAGAPSNATSPLITVDRGEGLVDAATKSTKSPNRDHHDNRLAISSDTANLRSLSQPDDTDPNQLSAGSGEDAAAKSTSDSQLDASALADPIVRSGWQRYAFGAASLLVIGLVATNVNVGSEFAQRPQVLDQEPSGITGRSQLTGLRDVRVSEDASGSIVLPELQRWVIPTRQDDDKNLLSSHAHASVIGAMPYGTVPAEVGRPSAWNHPKPATFQNEILSADLHANSIAHQHSTLSKVSVPSVPAQPEAVIYGGRLTYQFISPSVSGAFLTDPVVPPSEPIFIRASFSAWSGPELDPVAVEFDPALHEFRPTLHAPIKLLETPSSAGKVVWLEASALAGGDATPGSQNILAGFASKTKFGDRTQIGPRQIAMLGIPDSQIGRATRPVQILPSDSAVMLVNLRDPRERPRLQQAPADEETPYVVNSEGTTVSSGDEYFKEALALSADDPTGAAVLYTRAALRGHKRSAYYLGQIYETGDGVPVNLMLARAWYGAVGPEDSRARRRIRALPEPEAKRPPPSAPTPLWVEGKPDGTSEFVWTSGAGGDAGLFFVQVARTKNDGPEATYKSELSGAFLDLPSSVKFWRILAVEPTSAQYASSEWFEITLPGEAQTLARTASASPNVALTAVIAHAPGGASRRVEELRNTLASMSIPTRTVASQEVVGTGDRIYYFYSQDRDTAEALAKLTSEDAESSVSGAAPNHNGDMVLPGEILITLDDSRR